MSSNTLTRPTPWREILLVCRKCGKKQDGGFGDRQKHSLKSELRKALRQNGHRRDIRVIETHCLGVCPKDGITALNAGAPSTLHVIPTGTDPQAALTRLLNA